MLQYYICVWRSGKDPYPALIVQSALDDLEPVCAAGLHLLTSLPITIAANADWRKCGVENWIRGLRWDYGTGAGRGAVFLARVGHRSGV